MYVGVCVGVVFCVGVGRVFLCLEGVSEQGMPVCLV